MSIISDSFESDLDIVVWVQQVLEPTLIFHEEAYVHGTVNAIEEIEALAAAEISNRINKQIVEQLAKEIEKLTINTNPDSNIFHQFNLNHEQKIFCRTNGQSSYRNIRHSRAGPIR